MTSSQIARLAMAACLAVLSGCSDPAPQAIRARRTVSVSKDRHAQAEFREATVVDFWTGDKLAWRLHARSLVQEMRSQRVAAKPVELVAYDKTGKVAARILADSGNMDRNLRYFRARGHVVGTNQGGMRLQADSLLFDKDADRITTASRVTVRTEMGDVLTGKGFRSDSYLNRWEILSGVSGSFRDISPLQGLMQ
jgi:LPS export ABC transporter protein LptC